MAADTSVLILDDGELDDVRALLEELGAAHTHLRGGAIPERVEPPRHLFVATSRRAILARHWPVGGPTPLKVCVVTEDSNTLRGMLRRIGFDLLVRRPVHPYALRLLLLRALFTGRERRQETRVAVGSDVSYRVGLLRHRGVLADLSLRGARLLSSQRLAPGARVAVYVPGRIAGGRTLTLRARVLRTTTLGSPLPGAKHCAALLFDPLAVESRRRIYHIVRTCEEGPAVLSPQAAKGAGVVTEAAARASAASCREAAARELPAAPCAAPASSDERRKHPRAPFAGSATLLDAEAERVLVGRDLSAGGMRVAPGPSLSVGAALQLALYLEADEAPLTVSARVIRDDGAEGIALCFDGVGPEAAARIEALVGDLPSVESLASDESAGLGGVVSEILEANA